MCCGVFVKVRGQFRESVLSFFDMVLRDWTGLSILAAGTSTCCTFSKPHMIFLMNYLYTYRCQVRRTRTESRRLFLTFVTVFGRMTGKAVLSEVERRGQSQDVFVDGMWWGKKGVKDDSQGGSWSISWIVLSFIDKGSHWGGTEHVHFGLLRQAVWLQHERQV